MTVFPRARRSLLPATIVAVGVALTTAGSASAANAVPNGSFEAYCGATTSPCSWPSQADSSYEIQRDPAIGHASSGASYRLKIVADGLGVAVQSECTAPHPVSAGDADVSFWYRTLDARVNDIRVVPFFHDNATCSVSATGPLIRTTAPIADGEWHEVSKTVTITAAQASKPALWFDVRFLCASACPGAEVHLDDLVFEQQAPTAVTVATIRARHVRDGVRVRWTTHSEIGIVGFNVYRARAGGLAKVNSALIPSRFRPGSHVYSFLDRGVTSRGARLGYRLQAVHADGRRTWVGRATVGPARR